jgi:DNA-binding beta-propeller fold protein YncE
MRQNVATATVYHAAAGSGNGRLFFSEGLAVDSSGKVWVADTVNNRVQEFSEKGEYITQLGSKDAGEATLSGPQGVALAGGGNVWVADAADKGAAEWHIR